MYQGALGALCVLVRIERPGLVCRKVGIGNAVAGLELTVGIAIIGDAFGNSILNSITGPKFAVTSEKDVFAARAGIESVNLNIVAITGARSRFHIPASLFASSFLPSKHKSLKIQRP